MSMHYLASQSSQSSRKCVLPAQFYDHVSEIIKTFRKQMTIFAKLSSSVIQVDQAVSGINQQATQGLQTAVIYKQVIVDDNLYIVVQRFLSRVKEIIQLTPNLHLNMVGSIANCLKKLQMYLYRNVNSITMQHVFCDVLNMLPSCFQVKPFSPQKTKQKIKQHSTGGLSTQGKSALDHILESYRKSFSLLSTLDIDQAQYRAVFFSARDSRYKGTMLLENQMKHRNRFIKEEMNRFDSGYVSYVEKKKREKENAKKRRMRRIVSDDYQQTSIVRIVTTSKVRCKQASQHHPSIDLQSLKQASLNTPELKTISEIPTEKNACLQQTAYNFNRTRQRNGKSFSNAGKSDSGKKNPREDQFQDFIHQMKTKGEFRMTKVLFGNDGKLELSPFANQKKQQKNPFMNCLKNKIIFRRAQENIRKKFNRLTTEPPSSNKHIPQQQKSPPSQFKNYMITQHSDQEIFRIDPKNSKKVQKFAFKQRQVKLMGIKGVGNKIKSNSFDDSIKFWSNNISTYMREEERSMV